MIKQGWSLSWHLVKLGNAGGPVVQKAKSHKMGGFVEGCRMREVMGCTRMVSGHEVQFPRDPYCVQLNLMGMVLQALDHGDNALLEAPTGSGKTLALLCSAAQWLKERKGQLYKEMQAQMLPTDSQIERGIGGIL